MASSLFLRVVAGLTGAATAGEAIALVVGMHLLSRGDNPWISVKNDLLLAIDVLTGLAILIGGLVGPGFPAAVFNTVVVASLLTHGYREWEYLARAGNMFCANLPLFVMNNVKLIGLVIIIGWSLIRRYWGH